VFVDLATIAATATVESEEPIDLTLLPWPPVEEWVAAVRASALVAAEDEPEDEG
jgi:exodeoxyribonuclease V alpha subunit